MRRLLPLLLLAVLVTGCRTTAMKGTPFFSGENPEREGPVGDRVNLWPLAYYRAPALSVLWPIGEFSDDRFAIRPLFSMYRDGKDAPWHEYNWLGGLFSVDTETDDRVAFPFFWGEHYFNVFPLFWSGSDPSDGSSHNILFPLWVYSRKSNGDLVEFFPWPISGHFLDGTESRWFLFPLWDRTRWSDRPECYDDRFGLFLAGRVDGKIGGRRSWIFPLWYSDTRGANNHDFYSLLWASKDNDWRAIPLLLSGWSPDGDRGRILLGLGGWEGSKSWAFPLFYRDSATGQFIAPLCYRNPHSGVLLSPLWASKKDSWRCIPPLLSWWNADGSGRALLGLAGWDDTRAWAFPLFYRDAASDTLVTPLWATQAGRWSAIPPLLSWRGVDPATGESSLYLLGGLAGLEPDAHWFAPLYFRDEAKDLFVSLLYASGPSWHAIPPLLTAWNRTEFVSPLSMQGLHGGGIPPLLTWWDRDGGRVLLGLGGWSPDGDRHWALPFYYRDAANGTFASLLYAQGPDWGAIPPLLSWWNRDGVRALLGLAGWEPGRSWLFPLWYRDSESFLTPLAGRFGDGSRYWCTPLLGTRNGSFSGSTGSWLFPLWDLEWNHRPDDPDYGYDHRFLLLGGASGGQRFGGRSSVWFWPLFSAETNPDLDALRAEMDAPRLDTTRSWTRTSEWTDSDTGESIRSVSYRRDSEETGTHVLLGLGGTSHETDLSPGWWDMHTYRKLRGTESGPVETFLRPPDPEATNAVVRYLSTDRNWLFPLWSGKRTRGVMFDLASGEKTLDAEYETFSALLFLYDYRHESVPEENHDYARRRVLWRLYHYERLDGDESTDVFPAITYDRRKDGYRKFSFLWRLFRYERDPEKGTSLDVLFLPLRRP